MSNQTRNNQAHVISKSWARSYRLWEQGILPSPSADDLIEDALLILQVQADERGRRNLALIVNRGLEQNGNLHATAMKVVAYCNGSISVA